MAGVFLNAINPSKSEQGMEDGSFEVFAHSVVEPVCLFVCLLAFCI
jgi:hypothetical protein